VAALCTVHRALKKTPRMQTAAATEDNVVSDAVTMRHSLSFALPPGSKLKI